jgi:hypothetical protein
MQPIKKSKLGLANLIIYKNIYFLHARNTHVPVALPIYPLAT